MLPECGLASCYALALEPQQEQSIMCCILAAFDPFIGIFALQPSSSQSGVPMCCYCELELDSTG